MIAGSSAGTTMLRTCSSFTSPNHPSGGKPHRIELTDFLAQGTGSPEHRALLGMIGGLALSAHAVPTEHIAGPEPGAAGAEPTPGEEASKI